LVRVSLEAGEWDRMVGPLRDLLEVAMYSDPFRSTR
jgi:hypothetical protein